ncbi:DUF882 domain-containing protein [Rhizobium sp. KVB221]|uniref:Murein endopeptidase K n=1 Tax=Rhizobium setariae TaxID=2801340 RepID=A0A936YQ13_9HYPH|nr:DUF882 domain-containing protein [Rhizobium setariae]MBL0374608.1 DUF882 domain-containing protein [Rhizobium setariae]
MRKSGAGIKLAIPTFALAATLLTSGVAEAGQTRALKIYHVHSHEKATIVFKRNGRYDAAGLKKLNVILQDWRRKEPTRMDPRLFDLIWEVYQKSGSRDYIHVIGGYRAPETNAMLRSRSKGVAEKSQHVLGKAMDFYIPDVSLRKVREIGVKFQVGGVGFYPTSGSPFVHMDVGGVRAWPRLPRRELARLFPDGKTLHRPAEGGQMPGYAAAVADYKRRVDSDSIMIAGVPSKNSDSDNGRRKSLLAALFSSGDEDEGEIVEAQTQMAAAKPDRRAKAVEEQPILTAAADDQTQINAPVPKVRPAFSGDDQQTFETALLSPKKDAAAEAINAALVPQPGDAAANAQEQSAEFTNLAQYRIPVPQLLGARKRPGDSEGDLMTASLDPNSVAALAAVPVPGARPEVKVADAEDVVVPAGNLKPEEIAALAAETGDSHDDGSTDEDEVAGILDSLDNADAKDDQSKLAEMASLDISKDTATRSFELPAGTVVGDTRPVVEKAVKGGRPKKGDTHTASIDDSIRTEPKLTKNLIAQWAITKGRVEELSKPVKAPRFVSRTMRVQPTEVYSDGFTPNKVKVDPARFSGAAVNFLAVKKFAQSN